MITLTAAAMTQRDIDSAKDTLKQQVAAAFEIYKRAHTDGDTTAAYERLARWKERTVRLLAENVSEREALRLMETSKGSWIMGDPLRNLLDEIQLYNGVLQALYEDLQSHPDEVLSPALPAAAATAPAVDAPPAESTVVFIVHGHDELNLLRTKELLRDKWDLNPVVLSGEASRGRTVIEKFEEEAQRAVFAVILMTPDDFVTVGMSTTPKHVPM